RGVGVNYAAEFVALVVRAACQRLLMLFLIGDDATGPAADARVSAKERFAVLSAIFLKFARIHDARYDLRHIVLFAGIARKDSVDVLAGKEWVARFHMAERRCVWRPHLVHERANPRDARVVIRFAKIHCAADL